MVNRPRRRTGFQPVGNGQAGSLSYGRSIWPAVFFLAGFFALLLAVCYWFLLPAFQLLNEADLKPTQKRQLVAVARLFLVVILFVIVALMLLAFRVGRWFVPHDSRPARPTEYPDAWKEAGRRMPTPPPEDEE